MYGSVTSSSYVLDEVQVLGGDPCTHTLEKEVHMLSDILRPNPVVSWGDPPPKCFTRSCGHGYMQAGSIGSSPSGDSNAPPVLQLNLEVYT